MSDTTGTPARPARLLVIIGTLDSGGTERHLLNVLPLLDQNLVRPEIFVMNWRGQLAEEFEAHGITVISPWVSGSRTVRSMPMRAARLAIIIPQLLFRCLFRRPDIIHFFLPSSYILGGAVALGTGLRRRIMSRRSLNNYQARMPIASRIERWLHPRMSVLVGNSHKVVQQLIEEGARPDRVALIYNGVNSQRLGANLNRGAIRRSLALNDDAIVFVIVANLIPYKGHPDLLKALNAIKPQLPNGWRLLVVGRDDGMGKRLGTMVETFQFQDNVTFLGSRNDVGSLLAASDIGILCSHEEGFSNAILEGMAAGLPMIVSDVGGNAEAVIHGETGLVVPPGKPEALAQAIAALVGNPERRRAMGQAGRLRVEQSFSIESCVDDYNRLYGELLSGNTRVRLPSD
jgi:glycosyltransferase involved in cell wall biosynthesis